MVCLFIVCLFTVCLFTVYIIVQFVCMYGNFVVLGSNKNLGIAYAGH